MRRTFLFSALRRAHRHIRECARYRFYPLYSAGLAAIVVTSLYWPFDDAVFSAWIAHPWIAWLDWQSADAALALSICLGLVGLFRPGIIAKGLSVAGLWIAVPLALPYGWHPIATLTSNVLWYAFDLPAQMIVRLAGENTNASTMLWSVYLLVAWILLRPLFRAGFRGIRKLEGWIVERWPVMARLEKPVI